MMASSISAWMTSAIIIQCILLVDFLFADHSIILLSGCGACRAVVDNFCHATISGLMWLSITHRDLQLQNPSTNSAARNIYFNPVIWEVFFAVVLGSVVDLDHFASARSLSLTAATQLTQRPFAHAVLFAVCVPLIYFMVQRQLRASLLIFTTLISHQLRDATRRGLWFWPLGSTPPLHMAVVMATYCSLSLMGFLVLSRCQDHRKAYRGDDCDEETGNGRSPRSEATRVMVL